MHREPQSPGFIVRRDVAQAPFSLGQRVRVSTDSFDETADERYQGRVGVITGYFYDTPEEQFPHSPLVMVTVQGLGEELFFADELQAVGPRRLAQGSTRTAPSA